MTVTSGTVGVSSVTIDGSAVTDASDSLLITNNLASTGLTFSITGGAGNDSLAGASGADTISGGSGADSINGDSGNDVLTGDAGKDTITAGAGNDSIDGGTENDTIIMVANLASADSIGGGVGTDIVSMTAGGAADTVWTNVTSVETLTLTTGGTITLGALAEAAGIVTINGSTVADTISATAYTVGITYNEAASQSADSVALGAGNDVFVFSGDLALSQDDTLDGNAGTDVIRIDNSLGSATVSIDFSKVTDIEQIVVYDADGTTGTTTGTAQTVNVVIAAMTVTSGTVGVSSVTIDGSVITDVSDSLIITNGLASTGLTFSITGGAGADTLTGASGADTISGGSGGDTISGDSGNDVLSGDTGADTITGGVGNDSISGGSGDDSLNGNTGMDTMTGGAGADTFNLATASSSKFTYDTITDLTLADDDVIVFADSALTESWVSTAITLASAAGFSDYLNEAANDAGAVNSVIQWFTYGGNTYIVQDASSGSSTFVDGTDIVVEITGVVTLSAATLSGQSLTF